MSDGQPDVLIEVKHLDPLPVDIFHVGQCLEKIQLGGSCCDDDTGAPTIEDRTAHVARSPAPQGRSVKKEYLRFTYGKLFDCIRMAIENSGRINDLRNIGSLGDLHHVRSGYRRGNLSPVPMNEVPDFELALDNFNPEEKPMDNSDGKINRREFLQKSAVVAAGNAALSSTALSYSRIAGANDRISLGHIGIGNRGGELDGIVALLKDT